MRAYEHVDRKHRLPAGLKLQYHSRSSRPSQQLAEFVVDDLLEACPVLAEQAARGDVAYAIDREHRWPNGKKKKLDLALGIPSTRAAPSVGTIRRLGRDDGNFDRLLIGIEEKAVMTEHGKSQPRVFSELNDSHVIVHQGDRWAIAGGLTVVNVAPTFISPLLQDPQRPVRITSHSQPDVTAAMVRHLRGLNIRDRVDDVGFDAYCTFVMDVDNQGRVELHTAPPAPQIGDSDHYATFVSRLASAYVQRFANLEDLPDAAGLSVEEALATFGRDNPGTLGATADWLLAGHLAGGVELAAILSALDPADAVGEDDSEQ